ncbi:MAG: hypothetical protein N2747_06925 [Chitinophagaceae bacterium]|nr:hypothetical protein [Chitinophagaceae bacterium]
MKIFFAIFFGLSGCIPAVISQTHHGRPLPNTGISGVYEVVLGCKDAQFAIRYFSEFGFRVVDSATFSPEQAQQLYGYKALLKSYRLQNGETDSHGLLRIHQWSNWLGPGVGYSEPETIGSRMAVMMTEDIHRLYDIYSALRDKKEKWLPTPPVSDDLFGLNKPDSISFFKRPVYVKENAVYGEFFNHVFFQRYGYSIPGYGTINKNAPLKTSEFTHHDWIIKVDSMEQLYYLQTALGLKAEKEPVVDGDYLKGPKEVFMMRPGYSHYYMGFVSPNNICGKLKFFMPLSPKPDKSRHQRIGEPGITLHTFFVPELEKVYQLVKEHQLNPGKIVKNEFGEKSFMFKGPEGALWQILEKKTTVNRPETQIKIVFTNN